MRGAALTLWLLLGLSTPVSQASELLVANKSADTVWRLSLKDGRKVDGLRYEAYAALAESEGERILGEAVERFDIVDACCVHRVGDLAVGDLAVWVGVSAGHRGPAFEACRYIIDEVKARVPIWKHEHYRDGDAGWLHPQNTSPQDG